MGKRKRLMAQRLKEEREKKVFAKLKYVHVSPRKMRLVADMIRGMNANKALAILNNTPKIAARHLERLVASALNNWEQKKENVPDDVYIKEIYVDGAGMLKRIRPRAQGRAFRIRKRLSHVTVVLDAMSNETNENNTETE